ncbi:hypothetical protein G3N58_15245 [Paraburkholderia sp. Ac-20342]|uniref:hypothetical protein n=1 Tax=Paraburkholderia sp. Ac-20342 TaxID=2703889 RepID=UPI00197F9283|nr:hypothetical protein [Paraburkholderia sp. Ac-20342]MBN3848176.1 hypothetical protein [Paraburkholderia sp. Ac-20342]
MNSAEGIRRIAKAIVVLGWIWAGIFAVCAVGVLIFGGESRWSSIGVLIGGGLGLGAAKGIAWIVAGFGATRA